MSANSKTVTVRACIVDKITGEERIDESTIDRADIRGPSTILFHWGENNFSCDCNRRIAFTRWNDDELMARAEIEGYDPEEDFSPCGESVFDVPWVEIDGQRFEMTQGRR